MELGAELLIKNFFPAAEQVYYLQYDNDNAGG
jgi:hypothetical protein